MSIRTEVDIASKRYYKAQDDVAEAWKAYLKAEMVKLTAKMELEIAKLNESKNTGRKLIVKVGRSYYDVVNIHIEPDSNGKSHYIIDYRSKDGQLIRSVKRTVRHQIEVK